MNETRVPIDRLPILYGMPTDIASAFVGRTEKQTERRIAAFEAYIRDASTPLPDVPGLAAWVSFAGLAAIRAERDAHTIYCDTVSWEKAVVRDRAAANGPTVKTVRGRDYWHGAGMIVRLRLAEAHIRPIDLAAAIHRNPYTVYEWCNRGNGISVEDMDAIAHRCGYDSTERFLDIEREAVCA